MFLFAPNTCITMMNTAKETQWVRELPPALSALFPPRPKSDALLEDLGVVYEYKIIECTALPDEFPPSTDPSELKCTVSVIVRAAHPTRTGLLVDPEHLFEDIMAHTGARFIVNGRDKQHTRSTGTTPYRFSNNRYKCSLSKPTRPTSTRTKNYVRKTSFPSMTGRAPRKTTNCETTMKIRHWEPLPGKVEEDLTSTCGFCNKRGHRETSCCEAVGNCRVSMTWEHNHPVRDPACEGARRLLPKAGTRTGIAAAAEAIAKGPVTEDGKLILDDDILCSRLSIFPLMRASQKNRKVMEAAAALMQQLFPRGTFNLDTPSEQWEAHLVMLAEKISSAGIWPPPAEARKKYARKREREEDS